MRWRVALVLSFTLAACGGGGSGSGAGSSAPAASGTVLLAATSNTDAPAASACHAAGAAVPLSSDAVPLPRAAAELSPRAAFGSVRVRPLHESNALRVETLQAPTARNASGPFTAKDLRAMYQFTPMPLDTRSLAPEQRAWLGEGQTLYVVAAFHDPELSSNLAQYSASYGLPPCEVDEIRSDAELPLPPAKPGCTISVVGADARGNIAPLPGYDPAWAFEESLDVEMAHAAAPLARIVVIAAQGDDAISMVGAVNLANRMGNGVVSMSWAIPDQAALARFDDAFRSPGMLYVSGAGDNGNAEGPLWPSVLASVLAVGGTVPSWDGSRRSESAWGNGGGGMSSIRAVPPYQQGYDVATANSCVAPSGRMLPDVSLAATGLYAYLPGWAGTGYYVVSGTSASAPVWAGILATANAVRAQAGKPPIASAHEVLYGTVGKTRTAYASGMYDVLAGANGSCSTCAATGGFDLATGLGTPNVGALVDFFLAN